MNPFSCLAPRSANRQRSTFVPLICFVTLLPFALLGMAAISGCSFTSSPQPAKIGKVVAQVESPTVVQVETRVAVSEYLERAVKPAKQAKDAQLFTFVADAFNSFDGATVPTAADVEARIQSRTGTITDPDFPQIVAVGLDAWTVGRQIIPANASTATVNSYLNAVATGTIAGAALYLPKTAEAP